jgi:hypothetical protein
MIARALKECGVFLGPAGDMLPAAEENREGFWESAAFMKLNDDVLDVLGGSWDVPPPLPEGWERRPDLAPLEEQARALVEPLQRHAAWGWKDPRNSLTLPFWRRVLGEFDVVVCTRHPAEIASSLMARNGMPQGKANDLCLTYMRALAKATLSGRRVVVCYDSFLSDPQPELERLLQALGLRPDPIQAARALEGINPSLHHHVAEDGSAEMLPETLLRWYDQLRAEAAQTDGPRTKAPRLETQLEAARAILQETRETLYALQDEVATLRPLESRLLERESRLLEREAELTVARGGTRELEKRAQSLASEVGEHKAHIATLENELRSIKRTRLWRIGSRWWSIRAALRGRRCP